MGGGGGGGGGGRGGREGGRGGGHSERRVKEGYDPIVDFYSLSQLCQPCKYLDRGSCSWHWDWWRLLTSCLRGSESIEIDDPNS